MASESRVTREEVLNAFRGIIRGFCTTKSLAMRMGVDEHKIRASVIWLVRGGNLEHFKTVIREDASGRRYPKKVYRLTGDNTIRHCARDPDERKAERESRNTAIDIFIYGSRK